MREHLFLCGLSEGQFGGHIDGRCLHLHGPDANVRLKLDGLRRKLVGQEESRLTDYAEIASYVFAADRVTSRGGDTFQNMSETWRRHMRLRIAVREPSFWSSHDVLQPMVDALAFLSEDVWEFDFVKAEAPQPLQGSFDFSNPEDHGRSSIVLFSGGLDSLAGAVHELRTTNRHVVLLSHRNVQVMAGRQADLAEALKIAFPGRITHACIDQGLANGASDREVTQRTRTFFFTAIASIASVLENSDRIRFYENGIMSINLPISGQVVGTKASRSTHPRSLQLMQRLVGVVTGQPVPVDNPFIWKTKAEVVAELEKTQYRTLIGRSISCSRSRGLGAMRPHCGECAQCLQRRISTVGGGAADADPSEAYEIDFLLGDREDGPNRAMAVDIVRQALEFHSMDERAIAIRYAGELSRITSVAPTTSSAETARQFTSLFKRHGATVLGIVSDAIKANADAITLAQLPDGSLLRLLIGAGALPSAMQRSYLSSIHATAEEDLSEAPFNELVVSIDEAKRQVGVADLVRFDGPMEFAILTTLVRIFREDREAELPAEKFRGFLAKQIAEATGSPSDEAVRKSISRMRSELKKAQTALDGEGEHDDVIESVRGGYRLNPKIRLVAAR